MPKFSSHSERSAFEWADKVSLDQINDTHIQHAYRLNHKSCFSKPIPCKRNCRANPKCLYGLGEKKWLSNNKEDDFLADSENPNDERKKDTNVGLKNLGATCYVNSLLQVWFHNPFLREAIYKWKPNNDPKETSEQLNRSLNDFNLSKDKNVNFTLVSPLGQLQLIFSKLQFSLRSFVDPTQFVNSLEIDVSQQQDAQEFSKLFLTLIEEDLRHQKDPDVMSIVQKQYRGDYVYITKCLKCLNETRQSSTFYELSLNIKGHKDLYECLKEFFAPEKLESSDQVFCNHCQSKQNVERYIKLRKLPPYLNLQLLRFVYDRQKGRKKLNSSLKFPETLNLSEYFDKSSFDTPKKVEYKLCAVLMHRGQSCYSGHYIAQIKDRMSKDWFKFNDELVEKIDSKNLKLGSEDTSPSELTKGIHSSDDAYMLVYKDCNVDDTSLPPDNSPKWNIPEYLQTILLEDNSKFEERVEMYNQIKNQNLEQNKVRQTEIKSVYEEMIKNENADDCEWISKQWLQDWLAFDSSKPIPSINNSKATCIHSKLAISAIDEMKLVNSSAVENLYNNYNGGPRLKDACCKECVETKVRSIQTRLKINNDSKQITSILKFSLPIGETAYWVGKESLKIWKQLALKQCDLYEKSLVSSEFQNENQSNNDENSPLSVQSKSNSVNNSGSENGEGDSDSENKPPTTNEQDNGTSDKSNFNFNQDILCVHNRLSPDESNRKLVATSVWELLKSHFPSACEFDCGADCCQECLSQSLTNQSKKNELKQGALTQKQQLHDLYNQKKKITCEEIQINQIYYALSIEFYNEWKNFIRDVTHDKPYKINNELLLCEHQLLLHPPSKLDHNTSDVKYIIVTEQEWSKLNEYYQCSCAIRITATLDELGEKVVKSDPDSCFDCYEKMMKLEQERLLNYNKATIHVRFVQNKCDNETNDQSTNVDDDESDKSFLETGNKKFKKLNSEDVATVVTSGLAPRRSTRRRKLRDTKDFSVSSNLKLVELKVMIMDEFLVPTFDQNLFLNEKLLEGNDLTLSQLNIIPDSLICLKADETNGGYPMDEEYLKGTQPETGFKGTKLCNRIMGDEL